MRKTYLFSLLLLLTSLVGCFDSKEDQKYKNINAVEITFSENYRELVYGIKAKFEPKLSLDIDENSPFYTFTWIINGEPVEGENSPVFEWDVDQIFSNGYIALEISDSRNDMVYANRLSIDVIGPFETDYSWMILSDNGGKSQLSFFSCVEADEETRENHILFKETNFIENAYIGEGDLGSGPIAIQEHFRATENNGYDECIGNVLIFQESGAVDLEGQSFEKNLDIKDAFMDGITPTGATLRPATFMDYIDILADQDGKLYKRVRKTDLVYNNEYFLPYPLEHNDKVLEKCLVCRGYYKANRNGYAVIYDGQNKRLLYTVNGEPRYNEDFIRDAGRMFEFPAGPSEVEVKGFIPLNNFEGYDVLALEMYQIESADWSSDNYGIFMLVKEEATNALYIQKVYLKGSSGKPTVKEVTKTQAIAGLPSAPSHFAFPLYSPQEYLFIAVGNDLYMSNINNPSVPATIYYHFDSKITAINQQSNRNTHLAVGLEDGSFFVLDIVQAKNQSQEQRVIYESKTKVGKIVDLKYRQIDHWNY